MLDEQRIWNTLMREIGNPYGVAGLMGNLFAESSLNPLCKTGGDKSLSGWQYALMVDDGSINKETFIHDEIAFGLAQWRYWSRKESLYAIWQAQKAGTSIGDLDFQLDFLLFEIETYKTVWTTLKNATSVKEASDIVMERYEKPASVSEKAKEKRAAFGQGYFDKYAHYDEPAIGEACIRTTAEKVLVRSGNDKSYPAITRIEKKGTVLPFVGSDSENDWTAVDLRELGIKRVGWVINDFVERADK